MVNVYHMKWCLGGSRLKGGSTVHLGDELEDQIAHEFLIISKSSLSTVAASSEALEVERKGML